MGSNYIGYYTFDKNGVPTSHAFVTPVKRQIGPDNINILSSTFSSDGGIWMMYVDALTDNGTAGDYIGFQYNTSAVDVLILDGVIQIPNYDYYLSFASIEYVVSPSDSHQFGVGNLLGGEIDGTFSDHLTEAVTAYQSVGSSDSSSSNATIKAWGSEETLISTALSAYGGAVPTSIKDYPMRGSFFTALSVKDSNQTYVPPSSFSGPGVANGTIQNASRLDMLTGSGLSSSSVAPKVCRPDYPIGNKQGESAAGVINCTLEIIGATGAVFVAALLVSSEAIGCALGLVLGCILGVALGILATVVIGVEVEHCVGIKWTY